VKTQTIQKILTRDFLLGFFAQFIFATALNILVPTLPIFLSRLESRETEIGVLIGAFSVSSLVLRPFVGRVLSRIPERDFMIAGCFFFGLTCAAYLVAPPFWPFFFVRIFQGIGYAFFSTASFTLIANISPEAHRGQSVSYFFLGYNISLALGPSLGMFIINHFDFTVLFWVCSGLSLCALLITYRLGRRQAVAPAEPPAEDGSILTWQAIPPSIVAFFFFVIWGALITFFPLYAIKQGVTNPGPFFSTIALMLVLGRTLGSKILDLYSRERVLMPCLIAFIASMVILVFSRTMPLFIIVGIVWGIGHAFFYPSLIVYVIDRVGASRGPAMGTFTAISDLGLCLGPVIMGIIIHFTSYPIMFSCLALLGIANFAYFYFFVKDQGR
jgi:predicted MFS family arabinose efflux permease